MRGGFSHPKPNICRDGVHKNTQRCNTEIQRAMSKNLNNNKLAAEAEDKKCSFFTNITSPHTLIKLITIPKYTRLNKAYPL